MRKIHRIIVFTAVAAVLFLTAAIPWNIKAENRTKKVDIMFVSDVHSYLDNFSRLYTLIEKQKEKNPDTLLLDGGDFSMGTLVQTIYSTEAAELRMLGEIGIEATTFGNHEFDYRTKGLCDMLFAAKEKDSNLPQIVVCNVDWEAMKADLTQEQELLFEAFENYGVKPYTMIEKNGVNIAVIGVFGKDAYAYSPTCALKFKDPIESVKQTVKQIEKEEFADMIVCISHSGTNENFKSSEDEQLAVEVPKLDVIISGHSHTELTEPIVYGTTYIAACGEYAENLGSISLEQNEDSRWNLVDYKLLPVTEDILPNDAIEKKVESFQQIIDETYLKDEGYTADEILAYNPYKLSTVDELYDVHKDHNLGNLLSDAFRYTVQTVDTNDTNPVAIAVVPSGCVRESYEQGDITVEDVFHSYSLGIGADEKSGYPLLSVYLTGKELKTTAEIDASISDFMTVARLYCSGLCYTYNPNRIILNKVTHGYLVDENGNTAEIEDEKLYRVVADLYSGQMLGEVENLSYGLIKITPKFADGTPIENLEDAIVYDHGKEVKAWAAIASYLKSFPKNEEGVSQIPASYETAAERKLLEEETGFTAILSGLNVYSRVILLVGGLFVAGIFLGIVFVVRKIRKKIRPAKMP